ncbi:MAG: TIGR00341 family protein [Candidatus Ranarchaeia archaeon]
MRQIQAVIPSSFNSKKIADRIFAEHQIKADIIYCEPANLMIINTTDEMSGPVLKVLRDEGVGQKFGRISMTELISVYPSLNAADSKTGRVSVEEMHLTIKSNVSISQRYFLMIIAAAIVAGLGLTSNNIVLIIASMVISPLMWPIAGMSLASIILDSRLMRRSLFAEASGLLISVIVGFLLSFIVPISSPTREMLTRTTPTLFDLGLAVVSGVAAALCFTTGASAALTGIAISASLMPPSTTIGLFIGYYLHGNVSNLTLLQSVGSTILLLTNVFAIYVSVTLIFWAKKVKPYLEFQRPLASERIAYRTGIMVLALILISVPIISTSTQSIRNLDIQVNTERMVIQEFNHVGEKLGIDISIADINVLCSQEQINVSVSVYSPVILNSSTADAIAQKINQQYNIPTSVEIYTLIQYSARAEI